MFVILGGDARPNGDRNRFDQTVRITLAERLGQSRISQAGAEADRPRQGN